MAIDWIKMRTDLYRDPKVVMMADHLAQVGGDLGRYVSQNLQCNMAVTRNVTRNATVGALVTLWGVTRHRGKRYADDLVIPSAGLSVVDEITDMPGFGAAMASVGWVRETEEGLIFPHFFEELNTDPAGEAKAKAAARQRRYRQKQQEKSDVTVTSQGDVREEKRREEKRDRKSAARFVPPTVGEVQAYSDEASLSLDAPRFVDFYTSKDWKVGRNAMKDWRAAARNASRDGWCKVGANSKGEVPYDQYQADRQRRLQKTKSLLERCVKDGTDGQVCS